jgi:hypothetical protein
MRKEGKTISEPDSLYPRLTPPSYLIGNPLGGENSRNLVNPTMDAQ